MTDDATLSDFASSDDGSDIDDSDTDDSSDGGDGSTAGATDPADGPTAVDEGGETARDSGLSTYAWGEYTCGRCAEQTDRVWRADGALVCPACKEW